MYKVSLTVISTDMAKDARPFTMTRFTVLKHDLDTSAVHLRVMSIPGPVSSTSRPPHHRLVVGSVEARTDVGVVVVGPTRTCFHCDKLGHIEPNCPLKKNRHHW